MLKSNSIHKLCGAQSFLRSYQSLS